MTGSVQTKKGMLYVVLNYIDDDNHRKTKWISTGLPEKGNKKAALKILKNTIDEYESGRICLDKKKEIMFHDWLEQWLISYENQVRPNTYISYCEQMRGKNGAIEYFKKHPVTLQALSISDLNAYYNFKLQTCCSKTVKKHKHNIQKALEMARLERLIPYNPNNDIVISSSRDIKFVPSHYTADQVSALLETVKGDVIETAVLLASTFGLRRSEVLGLTWDSIDFIENKINVFHTAVKTTHGTLYQERTKNKSSHRVLPLSENVKQHLLALYNHEQQMRLLYKSAYIDNDLICKWEDGRPLEPNYVTKHFKEILKANNLPVIRFHDLRHSAATILLESDFTMKEVSEWLGHCDINTTMNIYAHVGYRSKEQMAERLSNMITAEIPSVRTPLELEAK